MAAVRYRIKNRTKREVKLEIIPHLQFAAKGQLLEKEQKFTLEGNEIHSGGMTVYFYTNGEAVSFEGEFCEGLFYAYDACDGRCSHGNTYINHKLVKTVPSGKTEYLEILYTMKKEKLSVKDIFEEAAQYRRRNVAGSGEYYEELSGGDRFQYPHGRGRADQRRLRS
ncbi:MAG: glycogen debranching enzyme N-terminal domain-containing protein [Eubacteriales bacterium]|nr:glycogen debranching enzyme N-terminal domain-containing protein [Eubacteriales bacterium]